MRLIDADELKKNFQDELCKGIACAECSMQAEGFCRVERWIDIAPTIEAEPIRHGRWIYEQLPLPLSDGSKECVRCSVCNTHWDNESNYCPNCGAKMDEVEE